MTIGLQCQYIDTYVHIYIYIYIYMYAYIYTHTHIFTQAQIRILTTNFRAEIFTYYNYIHIESLIFAKKFISKKEKKGKRMLISAFNEKVCYLCCAVLASFRNSMSLRCDNEWTLQKLALKKGDRLVRTSSSAQRVSRNRSIHSRKRKKENEIQKEMRKMRKNEKKERECSIFIIFYANYL